MSAEIIDASFEKDEFFFGTTLNGTIIWSDSDPGPDSDIKENYFALGVLRIGQDRYDTMSPESHVEDLEVTAYNCSIGFCRKTYADSVVINGILRETKPLPHLFSPDNTLYYNAPLENCDMRPGRMVRLRAIREFRGLLNEADPQRLLANNTPRMEELFNNCPDIKAISLDTSSYITSIPDTWAIA